MNDLAKKLSNRIRSLRGSLSQREFARSIGIDQATLCRIEQAQENITLKTLQKLVDAFQCDIAWIFDDSNLSPFDLEE